MHKQAKIELLKHYYSAHDIQLTWNNIEALQRVASTLQKNAENLCNIPDYQEKFNRTEELAWEKLKRIFFSTHIGPQNIKTSGDPRGYVLKIEFTVNGRVVSLTPHFFN